MKSVNQPDVISNDCQKDQTRMGYGLVSDTQGEHLLLDDNTLARAADSLGVRLIVGDLVAYISTQRGVYIISLLQAAPRQTIEFGFSCAPDLSVSAEQLELIGRQSLSLRSVKELTLETCESIKIRCRDLLQTATGSVISIMSNWIQRCDQGSIESKGLLRTDAGSQIVTAKADLRLDAKRINMG